MLEINMKDRLSTKTLTVTDANFEREVLQSEIPVLVDIWADWCGPCKSLSPTIDALADEYYGKVKVAKLDADQNQTAATLGVRSIPTVMLFSNGQVKNAYVGVEPKHRYQEGLDALLFEMAGEQVDGIY
jgi:thioredoxin 1